jgi:hypothetical protein
MSDLINISICHADLDDCVLTKMPVVPRIGESVAFWADGIWCQSTIENVTYEVDWKLHASEPQFVMVELYVTGGLNALS